MYAANFTTNGFVWKSSSLAVLFHGLNAEEIGSDPDSSSEMAQVAKTLEVRLNDSAGGYQLTVAKDVHG